MNPFIPSNFDNQTNNMRFLLLYFVVLVLFSCGKGTSLSADNKSKKVEMQTNEVLVTEVEGMVCAMGCGGSIRKELKSTGAVSRVEIDFKEGKEKQIIKISFDNTLISKSEIIKRMETINDGQFSVQPIVSTEDGSEYSGGSSEKSNVNMSDQTSFEIPNLFDLLSSLVIE